MLIGYILIISVLVGCMVSLKKKRFSFWRYIIAAFLGAIVGAGLSFGDSAVFLSFPVLNIWTVPVLFSILFSLIALFTDREKMLEVTITITAIFVCIGVLVYLDSKPSDYSGLFREELTRSGVERVGQPIEGFSAFIYLEAFPGFEKADFDNVQTLEGIYEYNGSELVYVRRVGNPVTSAEEMISDMGYKTLLSNFSKRVGVKVGSETDIAVILEILRERDIDQNSYIRDDFSISFPDGWYSFENGAGTFFVHDENIEIPQNTDGFALGPYFQVTMHKIDVEELFAQNLWTEQSEFLVSKEYVRIGPDEAIRVVTKAAGTGGEVLHYVFEATDGRVFVLTHYPYERGSDDTNDFERVVQSFMISYVFEGNTTGVGNGTTGI